MIESVEEEWSISGKTFNEFIFPRLRYLVFEVNIKPEVRKIKVKNNTIALLIWITLPKLL